MGPKKQQEKDSSTTEEYDSQEQLLAEVEILRQKLKTAEVSNSTLEERLRKNEQESTLQRDELVQTYQRRINDLGNEKDNQIRQLESEIALSVRNNGVQRNNGNFGAQNKYEVPLPRQILFDGKNSWESFINPFESMSLACRWDVNEKLFRLKNSLRGDAAEFVFKQLGSDTLDSYDLLQSALATRFKEKRSTASYLAELENRKYSREKESLAEYVADVKKLVIKGYPTADSATCETINLRHFLKGLQDSQAALFIGMQDPKTIDQARELLDNYTSIRDDVRSPRVRNVDRKQEYVTEARLQEFGRDLKSSIGKKIDHLANQLNVKSSKETSDHKRNQHSKKDVQCYRCQLYGHYAHECQTNIQRSNKSEN